MRKARVVLALYIEQNAISNGVIIAHKLSNKIPCGHSQGLGPHAIAVWRNSSTAGLNLRNEGVVFYAHHFGEVTLR